MWITLQRIWKKVPRTSHICWLWNCRTIDRIPQVSSEGGLTGWSLYLSSPHPARSVGFSIPCKVYVIHCINDSRSFWTKLPRWWNTICYLKVFSEFITKYISFYCKPSLANELNLTLLSFNVFFPVLSFYGWKTADTA